MLVEYDIEVLLVVITTGVALVVVVRSEDVVEEAVVTVEDDVVTGIVLDSEDEDGEREDVEAGEGVVIRDELERNWVLEGDTTAAANEGLDEDCAQGDSLGLLLEVVVVVGGGVVVVVGEGEEDVVEAVDERAV